MCPGGGDIFDGKDGVALETLKSPHTVAFLGMLSLACRAKGTRPSALSTHNVPIYGSVVAPRKVSVQF